ncbi:HD-containing protein [Venustampulla echinocandica]|uniref:HD-containing protein n=1 Tax=Venustampulla echinocandica TaxID=2656787 RepID=A0A370TP57_9HELO|nr:HD-containing protein [Venustampulla echinocandica]RDL37313.1 HD-containing protein [Venustampulla echinocandica]
MTESQLLIARVSGYVQRHMSQFDASHDYEHIKRVVGLAHTIYSQLNLPGESIPTDSEAQPTLDLPTITLSALLHDVGDRKYIKDGEDGTTLVRDKLLELGADEALATKVQAICLGVSYSAEVKDLARVKTLIAQHPELAVVQDADRLDAIGAVGIGRAFTYGGAKTNRDMEGTMEIFELHLLKVEALMKTEPGRKMARERTERLRTFQTWWGEEMEIGRISLPNPEPQLFNKEQKLDGLKLES